MQSRVHGFNTLEYLEWSKQVDTAADTSQFIGDLIQERDDLKATLLMRDATIRGLKLMVQEKEERIARLDTALYIARQGSKA